MTTRERRVLSFESAANVCGHPHDVLHHGGGVLEDVLVDLLVNVPDAHTALVVSGGIGLVDVPDLECLRVQDFAVNLELPRDVLELFFLIGHNYIEVPQSLRFVPRLTIRTSPDTCSAQSRRNRMVMVGV
jgi:hypothetical protein